MQNDPSQSKQTFQSFLDWFRSEFPYYHDKCQHCGASCKDDPNPPSGNAPEEIDAGCGTTAGAGESADGEPNEDDDDDFSFLGYVHPTPAEMLGNASRTELYRCRSCSSFTRFPRYNKALWVTSTQRGRCGEYSMLLYRMLRVLGYDAVRWVVDWADHVWVEARLGGGVRGDGRGGRWVHLDPCEAAVDVPLLYEGWGKNQTYIVAFHDPFFVGSGNREAAASSPSTGAAFGMPPSVGGATPTCLQPPRGLVEGSYRFPPVEDVTDKYTSDEAHLIEERRGITGAPVKEAIAEVSKDMVQLLQRLCSSEYLV